MLPANQLKNSTVQHGPKHPSTDGTICIMATKLLITALSVSAAVKAHPAIAREPCHSSDFSLSMRIGVGTDYVSLNAISNGTDSTLFLVVGPPSSEPGTPGECECFIQVQYTDSLLMLSRPER